MRRPIIIGGIGDDIVIGKIDSFKYLGSSVKNNEYFGMDVKYRIKYRC